MGAVAVVALVALAWAASGGGVVPAPSGPGASGGVVQIPGGSAIPAPGGTDAQIMAGAEVIARACSAYAAHYGYGPSQDEVGPDGGVAQFVDTWPTNPLTSGPMIQGTGPGNFQYHTAIQMPDKSYTGYIYGCLSDGQTYPVEFRY